MVEINRIPLKRIIYKAESLCFTIKSSDRFFILKNTENVNFFVILQT